MSYLTQDRCHFRAALVSHDLLASDGQTKRSTKSNHSLGTKDIIAQLNIKAKATFGRLLQRLA